MNYTVNIETGNFHTTTMYPELKQKWIWYVFGRDKNVPPHHLMVVTLPWEAPLWQRILTRILLRSVWERAK